MQPLKGEKMQLSIDWKAFYANGGYSNENSDPQSYYDESFYDNIEDDDYSDDYNGLDIDRTCEEY